MANRSEHKPHKPAEPLKVDGEADAKYQAATAGRVNEIPRLVDTAITRMGSRFSPAADGGQGPSALQGLLTAADKAQFSPEHLVGLSVVETSGRDKDSKTGATGPIQFRNEPFNDAVRRLAGHLEGKLPPEVVTDLQTAAQFMDVDTKGHVTATPIADQILAPYRNDPNVQGVLFSVNTQANAHSNLPAAGDPRMTWAINAFGPTAAQRLMDVSNPHKVRADRVLSKSCLQANDIPPGVSVQSVSDRFIGYYGQVVEAVKPKLPAPAAAQTAAGDAFRDPPPGWFESASGAAQMARLPPPGPVMPSPLGRAGRLRQIHSAAGPATVNLDKPPAKAAHHHPATPSKHPTSIGGIIKGLNF